MTRRVSFKYSFLNALACILNRPYSRLFFISDTADWVLNWEIAAIRTIAVSLGIPSRLTSEGGISRQAVFHPSKYFLLNIQSMADARNRIGFPYFHGYPTSGDRQAEACYEQLRKHHGLVHRIQVSHTRMEEFVLDTGISPEKVFLIPIGINADFFQMQTPLLRKEFRSKYNIPQEAVVVGSFQKDGNGWGEGLEPKLIKGPDIFLRAVELLRKSVPELFVLLSGPARGYVKQGLERMGIPYKHVYLKYYPDIHELFHCLDVYIVSSREEGGPKAVLESMASGIPLVTTKVGQAMDLVVHEKNAFMVDVEDAEGLAYWAMVVLSDEDKRHAIIERGAATARLNTYATQVPLWKDFFKGFVAVP